MASEPQPEDQTSVQWRDNAWLAAYPLDVHTVLDYFAFSPFYDLNCNNEEAKRRGVDLRSPYGPVPPSPVLSMRS